MKRSLESPATAMQTPFSLIFLIASTASFSSTSFKITFVPAFASLLHISRPMPCPAPVTMATLPVKDIEGYDKLLEEIKLFNPGQTQVKSYFFFDFADLIFFSLFFDEIDFRMVCPFMICFLSFTFLSEFA